MGCLLLLVAASLALTDGRALLASKKRQKAKAAPAAEVRTVNATEADFDYRWRAPIVRGWQRGNKKHVRIRGIMNTGTNFLRTLLNKVGGLKITEERKHMFPWVLEQRGAAYQNSVAVVIARHPLSWITGMRKAPYFLDCKSEDPDATCWMRLVWKENNRPEKIEKSYASIIDVWNAYYSAYLDWRGSANAASYFYFSRHSPGRLDADPLRGPAPRRGPDDARALPGPRRRDHAPPDGPGGQGPRPRPVLRGRARLQPREDVAQGEARDSASLGETQRRRRRSLAGSRSPPSPATAPTRTRRSSASSSTRAPSVITVLPAASRTPGRARRRRAARRGRSAAGGTA